MRVFWPGAIPLAALQAGGMMSRVVWRTWAWLVRRSALVLLAERGCPLVPPGAVTGQTPWPADGSVVIAAARLWA
jgi:hypothetical protein